MSHIANRQCILLPVNALMRAGYGAWHQEVNSVYHRPQDIQYALVKNLMRTSDIRRIISRTNLTN